MNEEDNGISTETNLRSLKVLCPQPVRLQAWLVNSSSEDPIGIVAIFQPDVTFVARWRRATSFAFLSSKTGTK